MLMSRTYRDVFIKFVGLVSLHERLYFVMQRHDYTQQLASPKIETKENDAKLHTWPQ